MAMIDVGVVWCLVLQFDGSQFRDALFVKKMIHVKKYLFLAAPEMILGVVCSAP
jgi:hypothetical protein